MINKLKLLSHINDKDEKIIFSKLIDEIHNAEKVGYAFSEFYPPTTATKFLSLIGDEIEYMIYGGYPDAERVVVGFFSYKNIDETDFPITRLKIEYNSKFVKNLTHRDFLGSILGLQIDRSKIGDILIFEDNAIAFVKSEIASFITSNLIKVKNATVNVSEFEDIVEIPFAEIHEKHCVTASLRIDAVISQAFNISRTKSADYISGEKVFVNWILVNSAAKQISEGDVITVRGLGRCKILNINGKTKKDRISLTISINK